jgi:hypothetical protein
MDGVSERSDPPPNATEAAQPSPESTTSERSTGKLRQPPLGAGPRDMLISMLVLLPIVGLVAVLGRGCSFAPAGPTVDSAHLPNVDIHGALPAAARAVPFELREPSVPAGWRANSVDQRPGPGGAPTVRVGWVTTAGRYLRLVQSAGQEGELVAAETQGPPRAARPVAAAGATWVDYQGGNGERAWTRRADGAQWLITGDATAAEFDLLARAITAAAPLSR